MAGEFEVSKTIQKLICLLGCCVGVFFKGIPDASAADLVTLSTMS